MLRKPTSPCLSDKKERQAKNTKWYYYGSLSSTMWPFYKYTHSASQPLTDGDTIILVKRKALIDNVKFGSTLSINE
jgi:hypothetical protein